ncbi:WG repeat-containing protein [Aureisphaera galaxeae]|uniref:WG repeat-containing protein n=1 Tax=Aureisphaera galaxeae TaxID=1538023 RepID=UPI0023500991|nr:WG repeat-containing protein [Aureisphaera galaxeae]MDC8004894.1 WG repeat-containing protein [Aureisphaera galaxeae]
MALESELRIPFQEGAHYGFIDPSGKEVIPAIYKNVGVFTEGLAPVRKNGTFGYINKNGKEVIESKFDMAHAFVNGQAKVYMQGKAYFINKDGNILFDHHLKNFYMTENDSLYICETNSGKYGVVDQAGNIIIDTLFQKVFQLNDELFDTRMFKEEDSYEGFIKVFDSKGNRVFKNFEIDGIGIFQDGIAKVEPISSNDVYVNGNGEIQFEVPKEWKMSYDYGYFQDGKAIVDIYTVDPDTIKRWSSREKYTKKGVINTKGEILFSNTNWKKITSFYQNRAFVQDKDEKWFLIDETGNCINDEKYDTIHIEDNGMGDASPFQKGTAFVERDGEISVIDMDGDIVGGPIYFNFEYDDLFRIGNTLFIQNYDPKTQEESPYSYGIWNWKTDLLIPPKFYNMDTLVEGEIWMVEYDGKLAYINNKGKEIWQQKGTTKTSKRLNIDYMNRGYFIASSPTDEELSQFGGWAGSSNKFKRATKKLGLPENGFNIVVRPEEKSDYYSFEGMKLYLSNNTQDTLFFSAQDSRIYMVLQAKDLEGNWKDIEFLPNSWCGNSYHYLFLPKEHFWEFNIPKYEGAIKTTLRAKLTDWYTSRNFENQERALYSNEFEGTINPAQLWSKRPYTPTGIMDPYDE